MVAPVSSSLSADGLVIYQSVVRRAIEVFTALIALYEPDIHSERDWADITVSESRTQRDGLGQRLAIPTLSTIYTSTLVGALNDYLTAHWADYERIMPNPAKRAQVLQLHAQLQALMDEVAPVNNALQQQERTAPL